MFEFRFLDDVADALVRMAGIDRHVGGAGLEAREDRNDRQLGALEGEAHQLAGTDAARLQVMRELVGPLFKLGVSP